MKLQNAIMIFIALICGVAAVFLTKDYINSEIEGYKTEIDKKYKPLDIIVANRNLQRGEVMNKGMLAVRSMPSGFVHKDAIRPSEVDSVIGHKLVYSLNGGEALLTTHVAFSKGDTFSNLIEEGKRALTFPVDVISSVSGLVSPGDIIDLLVTLDDNNVEKTISLQKNVTIMATNQVTDELSNPDSKKGSASSRIRTITVHVTPEEASKIVHARTVGKITVTLRSRTDAADLKLATVTKNTLFGRRYGTRSGPRIIRPRQK